MTYTHLENDWLQPLLDFGAPAGLLLVGALAWLWLRAARRRDLDWPEVGLLAGAGALAAQGLVDFSLERPAAALALAVMLGLLQRGEGGLALRRGGTLGAAGALGLAAVTGMALWWSHPTDGDAAAVAAAPDPAAAEALARRLDRWHPADWLPPALVGGRWVEAGRCAPAMPWLLEAMRRNPTAPEPHLHAARCLAAAAQEAAARREYRLAYLFGRGDALVEAARRWPSAAALREVAPASGPGLLEGAATLRRLGRPAEAAELLRQALDDFGETRALAPLAGAALEAGDPAQALALARRLEVLAPLDPEGWRLASAALLARGERQPSDTELVLGLARIPGAQGLVAAQVERALAAGRPAEALRLSEGMTARSPGELAVRDAWAASALAAMGRLPEAIERLRSAAAALPEDAWPQERLAAFCAQAGRLDDAVAALEHAAALPGQAPAAWTARLEALRKQRDEAATRRRTEGLLRGR